MNAIGSHRQARRLPGLTAALGGLALTAALAGPTPATAQEMTLTYATNTATTGVRGVAETIFIEALQEETGGALEVVPYWGSSLMDGDEILTGVRDGVADMGFVNINYYPNRMLLNSAFNLFPRGPVDYLDKAALFNEMYDEIPELAAELADENQRLIYVYAVMPFAGTFKEPVDELEDFAGKRIRAASRWYLNLLGGLGATPVSVPWSDTYQALQTGNIDAVFTNIDGIHRISLDEIAPNVFVMEELWSPTPFLLTINQDRWDALSDEMKAAFGRAAEVARDRFAPEYDRMFQEIIEAQRAADITVTFAEPDEIRTFAELPEVQGNRETWAEEARDAGAEDPEAILARIQGVIDGYLAE
jgi:TRAP-type C4-dicarboxylate transport system substrate-binding protein